MSEEKSRQTREQTRISRRQLLKTLAATGGAIAASSLLPDEWSNPVVDVGTLPAHAQISPTPSPIEISIYECLAQDVEGEGSYITQFSTVQTWCSINPIYTDVLFKRTIRLNDPETGTILLETTGYADASGLFHPANVYIGDLGTFNDGDTLYVVWDVAEPGFTSPGCTNELYYQEPQ